MYKRQYYYAARRRRECLGCNIRFTTYEILEENTVVYEYKTGPYTGVENDKVFLEVDDGS